MKKISSNFLNLSFFTVLINQNLIAFSEENWLEAKPDPYTLKPDSSIWLPVIISFLVCAAILIAFFVYKRKKKKDSEDELVDAPIRTNKSATEVPEEQSKGRVMIQPLFDDNNEIREIAVKKLENIYEAIKENNLTLNQEGFLEEPIEDEVIKNIYNISISELENAQSEIPNNSEFYQVVKDGISVATDYPESIPGSNAIIGTLKSLTK